MTVQQSRESRLSSDDRYWAFISYSQRDVRWACWLQNFLETYRIPRGLPLPPNGQPLPARLFPIFRDRDELPSASDLGEKIRNALHQSRNLIVICSPQSARSQWVNQEVQQFKAFGRSQRVFPIIIGGEPFASDRPNSGLEECMPPAVRFQIAPDGTLTDKRAEPIAADARRGKDGRQNAALKLVAGILDVGFDVLKNRDAIRRRRQRRLRVVGGAGAVAAAGLAFIGLADTGLNVPGGTAVRRQLDRARISVFRPVAADPEVTRNLASVQNRIHQRLIGAVKARDLENTVWNLGQMLTALYGDSATTPEELRMLPPIVDSMFRDGFLIEENGQYLGWNDEYFHPRAEAPLWTLMALAAALGRREALSESQNADFRRYLDITQRIAERYYLADEGGWRVVTEDIGNRPYLYTTAIALHSLLDLRGANLGWHADRDRLDDMIRRTSDWLQSAFRPDPGFPGWGRTPNDDKPADRDLNILVFSALGRAHLDADIRIQDEIEAAAVGQLADLWNRRYHPTNEELLHQVHFPDDPGRKRSITIPTRVMWYPWSNKALPSWMEYVEKHNRPTEQHQALRRSRSHLLTTLFTEMEAEITNGMLFVAAENAYGLRNTSVRK